MECPIKTCSRCADCGILGITKKIPQSKSSCSYYKISRAEEKKEISISPPILEDSNKVIAAVPDPKVDTQDSDTAII